jgi:hypothetical protein
VVAGIGRQPQHEQSEQPDDRERTGHHQPDSEQGVPSWSRGGCGPRQAVAAAVSSRTRRWCPVDLAHESSIDPLPTRDERKMPDRDRARGPVEGLRTAPTDLVSGRVLRPPQDGAVGRGSGGG